MGGTLLDHAIEATTMACLGLLTFLVRSYFTRIREDLQALRSSVDKLEGRFNAARDEAKETALHLAVTSKEVRTLWKFMGIENGSFRRQDDD